MSLARIYLVLSPIVTIVTMLPLFGIAGKTDSRTMAPAGVFFFAFAVIAILFLQSLIGALILWFGFHEPWAKFFVAGYLAVAGGLAWFLLTR